MSPALIAFAELLQSRPRQSFLVREASGPSPIEAAVLVPLVLDAGKLHMWMLKRPGTMRTHAGQVAFPGGRRDPEDASTLAAALREAHEEIGLSPSQAQVLGPFDDLTTPSGYRIFPHVALVPGEFTPVPSPVEVERVLRVPLQLFTTPPKGEPPFWGYELEGVFIWGATFYIARQLVELLRSSSAAHLL